MKRMTAWRSLEKEQDDKHWLLSFTCTTSKMLRRIPRVYNHRVYDGCVYTLLSYTQLKGFSVGFKLLGNF